MTTGFLSSFRSPSFSSMLGRRRTLGFFSAPVWPLSRSLRLIVQATEHIASRTGDAVGGLLNATFGNAPELIIATVALKAGLFDMVRASLIGAILANLLLAQGVAFLLGGLRYHNQEYNPGCHAGLQLDDAHRRHQPGGAELIQPLLFVGRRRCARSNC